MPSNTCVKVFGNGIAVFALTVTIGLMAASGQTNVDPEKKAALDRAFKAGVLTQDEYNAKLRALSAKAAPTRTGDAPSKLTPTDPAKVDWKIMTVLDPIFSMPAYRVRIPSDWKFEGAVVRTACEDAMLVYRAESPDGLTGVQMMPKVHWVYSQNNQALQQANKACGIHAPVSAVKQAPVIAAAARPHPEIGTAEPISVPGSDEMFAKLNASSENAARSYGTPNAASHTTGDGARVRIHYNYQGHAEEEFITVTTNVEDAPVAVTGTGNYGIIRGGWAHVLRTDTYVSGARAPQGRLDAVMPLLKGILIQLVPDYDQAVLAFRNKQFQMVQQLSQRMFEGTLRQGQINQQGLMANHNAYMQFQQGEYARHNAQFYEDMRQKDANNKNFVDYVSNQTYYVNPETGATVTVKDVPGADGVVAKSMYGGWVQLQPISH